MALADSLAGCQPCCVFSFPVLHAVSTSAYFRQQFRDKNGDLSSLGVLGASASAGVLAAALDTPADTIKTRLQAGQGKYTGIVDCARKTWAEEGARGFGKGLVPRVLIISPLFGITMVCVLHGICQTAHSLYVRVFASR